MFPDACLRPVLYLWLAFSASTSGVEQAFSRGQSAFTDRQQRANPITEWSYIKLATDGGRDSPDRLARLAQIVWVRCGFGLPRASGKLNRALRRTISRKQPVHGEAAFLRQRRAASLPLASSDIIHVRKEIAEMQVNEWTDAHQKELLFATAKLDSRLVQAEQEHLLNDDETSDDLRNRAACKLAEMRARVVARESLAVRVKQKVQGGPMPTRSVLRGLHAFVQEPSWAQALPVMSMLRTVHPWAADVFVMAGNTDFNDPRSELIWAAVLRGSYVMTPAALSSSPRGCCLKYLPALCLRRIVHITEAFRHKHRQIYNVITMCCANTQPCNWVIELDLAKLRPSRTCTLVLSTGADLTAGGPSPFKVLRGPAFLDSVRRIDAQQSCFGPSARSTSG